jgi:predicted metal-dependent peptidase
MAMLNQKLAEARIFAARKMPYMTHQVMSLLPVERPGLGTMAVDDYCRLYFDPAFLEGRDLKHLAFVVLHEAVHVWGRHARRALRLLGEKPARDRLGIWRTAVDAAVNDVLEQSGLRCPDEGITPAKLGLPRNKTPEEYFDLLLAKSKQEEEQRQQQQPQPADTGDEQDPQPGEDEEDQDGQDEAQEGQDQGEEEGAEEGQDQGEEEGEQPADGEGQSEGQDGEGQDAPGDQPADQPGEDQAEGADQGQGQGEGQGEPEGDDPAEVGGSAADGQPRPWEDGPPSEEHPGLAEHEQNIVEAAVAKAIEQYEQQRGRGSVPGGLARQAADLLHPKVDPARELLAKVKYAVGCTSGFGDFTYRRPNRRQPAGGALLPAHVKPIPRVTVIADTSGSMKAADLALALGVIQGALRSLPDPRGLRVLAGDTTVACAKNVFRPEQVELCGGGGTDMSALIVTAAEERPAPKAILVVTDGETGWPSEPVAPRVVACLTRKPRYCPMPPKWIDTVILNPEE